MSFKVKGFLLYTAFKLTSIMNDKGLTTGLFFFKYSPSEGEPAVHWNILERKQYNSGFPQSPTLAISNTTSFPWLVFTVSYS